MGCVCIHLPRLPKGVCVDSVSRVVRTGARARVCVYKDSDEGIVDDFAEVGSVFSQCSVNGLNLGRDRVPKLEKEYTLHYFNLHKKITFFTFKHRSVPKFR